jgi:hypothetical protein
MSKNLSGKFTVKILKIIRVINERKTVKKIDFVIILDPKLLGVSGT